MRYPVKDCKCEDFPCCEHADNFPDTEPEYCDACGGRGHSSFDCYPPEEEDRCEICGEYIYDHQERGEMYNLIAIEMNDLPDDHPDAQSVLCHAECGLAKGLTIA